ncbi:ESPR-type extended signal peptide-containing protein [Vreelandella zhaodongensis]|uniref:ESPR-type extended signal peptide-containing protein n=1 Tax=Vreelandella zhaodongensis TaxID=1176240 RepID=UPI003EBD3DE3
MNNVFRLIWNRTLGRLVVASEAARSKQKAGGRSQQVGQVPEPASRTPTFLRPLTLAVALSVGGLALLPNDAHAYAVGGADGCATGNNTRIAIGEDAQACADNNIAIGAQSVSSDTNISLFSRENPFYEPDLVGNTLFNGQAAASVALGVNAEALGGGVAIGGYANTARVGVAIGAHASAAVNSLALGPASKAANQSSLAFGRQSFAGANFAQAIGNVSAATAEGALAIGHSATAEGSRAIAIGAAGGGISYNDADKTHALGDRSIVIGFKAQGLNASGVTIGHEASVIGGAVGGVAVGAQAQADTASSTALGAGAKASSNNTISIGSNRSSPSEATGEGAQAIGNLAIASGVSAMAYGRQANASGAGGIAMGQGAAATQDGSIAIGGSTEGFDGTGAAQATGEYAIAMGNGAIASGEQSISIGYRNEVSGAHSGAVGDPNIITGDGSYALGNDNEIAADDAGAFGNDNIIATGADGTRIIGNNNDIDVADAFVIGNNANVTEEGGVALGSESVADTAAGVAGYVPFGATAADTAAIEGTVAQRAAVDVGSRQITSVAAGTELDDAVNVSQLIAAQSKVEAGTNVADVVESENPDGGTIYTVNADGTTVSAGSGAVDVTATGPDGDNVTDYAVDLSQASKDSLELADSALQTVVTQIDGTEVKTLDQDDNVANFVTGDNIVLTDEAGGIKIATADDVTFTSVTSDSLAITGGPTLTGGGIDMNNTTISNLADGVDANDAVNLSQLEDAAAASKTEVEAGTNVASVDQTTGADGQAIYTVNADGSTVSAGSGAVDVTATGPDGDNVTDYAVDLSQASKDSLELADSALQTVVTQIDGTEVKTLDQDDNVANFVTGDNIVLTDEAGGIKIATAEDVTFTSVTSDSLAITGGPTLTGGGIDMNNTTISNLADGVNANDAVNLSQLEDAAAASKTEVEAGTNVASVDQTTGADGQAIYTVNADGTTVSAGTGMDVVATGPDANNVTDFEVALNQDTQDSLLLADSALQSVVTQIDGTEVKTLDQDDNVANFITGDNIVLTDEAGGIKIATAEDVTFTSINSDSLAITGGPTLTGGGIDMNNTTISNLADGVNANDAVNLSQLEDAAAASKTEVEAGTNVASVDQTTGADGQDIYTVNADGTTVSAGSGAVDVTATGPDGDNVTDYAVDLSQASKDSLELADSALQTVVTQIDGTEVKTLDQDDNVANFITGDNIVLTDEAGGIKIATAEDVTFTSVTSDSLAITGGPTLTGGGIDMNNTTISNLADGVDANDAVNLSQLEDAAAASRTEVEAGTNVASVDQTTGADGQDIYTVNADGTTVSAGSGAVDVTATGPDGDNVTDYAVDLSQASKDSLELADSALQTVVTQIDGTEVKTLDQDDNVANFVTGDNIVLTDEAGGIKIATADDVTFTSVTSDSLAITGGPTLTGGGIDMNNTTISNLADGVDANDAVNLSQLESSAAASRTEVEAGTNVASVDQTTGADGQDIYTVNADGTTVSAGSGAVDVTATGPDGDNVTDYAVDLSQASKDSLELADSALQTVVTQIDGTEVKTLDQDDNVANFVTGDNIVLTDEAGGIKIATAEDVTFTSINSDSLAITGGPTLAGGGIDMNNTTISNLADGVDANDAVNLSQLEDAAAASRTEVEAGTNVASVDQTTGADGQDIYTVNADGSTVSAGTGVDVVAAAPDANNVTDFEVALNQETQDSLTLADSALQTVVTQIDGTEVKTLDQDDNVANFVTGDNIVLTDEAGGIKIATADDVTFTSVTSDSLAITGGPTLTGGGIDMNNTTISNLADGVDANDAVNLSQLESSAAASRTEVEAGTNVASVDQTTGADGQDIYTVNADGTTVSAGSGAVDVTATGPDGDNVTDYAVDLSQASKDSLELADSALQTVVTQIDGTEVKTLDQDDNVANFVTGDNIVLTDEAGGIKIATADDVTFTSVTSDSLAITGGPTLTGGGIDMNNTTISNLADGVDAQDAVNLSQLEGAAAASRTEVEAGTNIASVDQTTGADGQDIYTVNADGTTVSAGSGAVDVTATGPDGDNVTDYAVDLSQASKDSLELADSALQTVVTQIDGTEVKTLDQDDNVANFVTGDNIVLTDEAGGIKIATAEDVTFTSVTSDSLAITGGPTLTGGGIDMNNTTISNLADGVNANDAVNLSQLEDAAAASKTEVEAGTNVASVDQTTGADGQAIYTVNADGSTVSAGSGAVDVTATGPDGDNVTDYAVDLSQASKDSLELADSALQTVVTQIDGTEVKTLDQDDNVANFVTGDNIVLTDEAGGIKIATADDVTFTSVTSDSLAITGGPTLTGGGIDMNNTTISNLADGVDANDAVNLSQLESSAAASRTEVEAGTNIASVDQTTGADGQAIYTVNADGSTVSAGSGAVDVTATGPDGDNVTDYAVDLSQASKDSLELADSALQTVVTQIDGTEVKTLDQDDNVANFVTGDNIVLTDEAGGIKIATADDVTFTSVTSDSLAITGGPTLNSDGIDMGGDTITNVGAPVNGGDALNLDYFNENRTRYYSVNDNGNKQDNFSNDGATGVNAVAIGTNAVASGNRSIALGDGAQAIGVGSFATSGNTAQGNFSTAMGVGTTASGTRSMATGLNTRATNRDATAMGELTVASGFRAVAMGHRSRATNWNATAMGEDTVASGITSTAMGELTIASGNASTAMGARSQATADASTAMGYDTLAEGTSSTATGYLTKAIGSASTAMGNRTVASGGSSTAMGNQAIASGAASTSIGTLTVASGDRSFAIGRETESSGLLSVAMGYLTEASGNFSLATGQGTVASGPTSIAMGFETTASGDTATAFGSQTTAEGPGATAMGFNTEASGSVSTAIGNNTVASGNTSTAMGFSTTASGIGGFASGFGSEASGDYSTAMGVEANALGFGAMALGTNSIAQGDRSLAWGGNEFDSGDETHAYTSGSIALGRSVVAGQEDGEEEAVAMGYRTQATGDKSLALGYDAVASGPESIAIGSGVTASGEQSLSIGFGNQVSGNNSGAIGDPNIITGTGSYALGNNNEVAADGAGVFGNDNIIAAGADGTRIIGNNNDIDVADAFVMGNEADVTEEGGVALGSGSVADTGAGIQGYNPTTGAADGLDAAIAATESTTGAVAVGDADGGVFRQITGVAAGTEDSDAVNVSQLKALGSTPLTFSGDTGSDVDRQLGETLNITGAADASGNTNISTVADGTDTLEIVVTDQPTFGNVTINTGGDDTINGLSNTTFDPDNFTSGQAASEDQLKQVSDVANTGWNIQANGDVATNVAPDDTVQMLDGKNIDITRDGTDITVATADSVAFDDVTITGGPTLTGGGIDMNNTTISNLADGVNANDAVNLSQLEDAAAASKTEVEAGTNVASVDQATGADGQDIYTVNADGTTVSAGTGVDVTAAAPDANNVTDFEVALNQDTQDSLLLADSALQSVVTQIDGTEVKTLDQDDNVANFVTGDNIVLTDEAGGIKIATAEDVTFTSVTSDSLAITGGPTLTGGGIDMNNTTISNLADGVDANDAVNLSQLEDAAAASRTEVEAGTNVASVDQTTGADGQDIYTVNADGSTVSAGTGVDVVAAAPDANNVTDFEVALN